MRSIAPWSLSDVYSSAVLDVMSPAVAVSLGYSVSDLIGNFVSRDATYATSAFNPTFFLLTVLEHFSSHVTTCAALLSNTS